MTEDKSFSSFISGFISKEITGQHMEDRSYEEWEKLTSHKRTRDSWKNRSYDS